GRIKLITLERRTIATEDATAKRVTLASLDGARILAAKEEQRLAEQFQNQEAYYCRQQLFAFIRAKKTRYARDNPRSLANAIAALPYITCRQSAARCAKLPTSKVAVARSYDVF